jgi:uncharacterized protein (DUF1684 family)
MSPGLSKIPFLVIGLTLIMGTSCLRKEKVISDEEAYRASIEDWQHQRLERLKSKQGWLNLAGLFWLQEGENRFGSDPSNDIVFPEKAGAFSGILTLENGRIHLEAYENSGILWEDRPVREMELRTDQQDSTTLLTQGDLAWYIIRRADKSGIRLRDYAHPRLKALDHIPCFPVNPHYVVEAELKRFKESRTLTLATPVEGITESYECPGELHFRLGGNKEVLYPFQSGSGYFLVFADATTGLETYGAGRFMYTTPDSTGRIILDFNKAYNPPCAFSPFATCPMPPEENFLKVAVEAGEKSVHLD